MKKLRYLVLALVLFLVFGINVNAASNPIKNGIYTISSGINNDFSLDANGGVIKKGTNIQLYKSNTSLAQQWKVTYLKNGYYSIVSAKNNRFALDVAGGKKKKGTNVQLWKSNKSNAQQWLLKDAGGGYYYIISRSSGLYLDAKGGKAKNKTNIQVWTGNKKSSQKFVFSPVVSGKKTIKDGVYVLSTAASKSAVLELSGGVEKNGSNIWLYNFNNSKAQQWVVKYLGDGTYEISNYNPTYSSGMGSLDEGDPNKGIFVERCYGQDCFNMYVPLSGYSLDVAGGKKTKGANVILYKSNRKNNQRWIIKDAGGGYYNVISKLNGLSLDAYGGKTTNKTNIDTWTSNTSNAQKFKFTEVTNLYPPYVNITECDEEILDGKCFDIAIEAEEDVRGFELYEATTENGEYKKVMVDSHGKTRRIVEKNAQLYFKARIYKDTYNGRAYSAMSDAFGMNLLNAETTLAKVSEEDDTITYKIGLDLPDEEDINDEMLEGAILEVSLYDAKTDTFKTIATERGKMSTNVTLNKDDYDSFYRLRVSIIKDGKRLYSDYEYVDPLWEGATIPSFEMNVVKQDKDDGSVDLTVSTDQEADGMVIYTINENGYRGVTLYSGEELTKTFNFTDNVKLQMQLFRYRTVTYGDEEYRDETPIATSQVYTLNSIPLSISLGNNGNESDFAYIVRFRGIAGAPEGFSYGTLYLRDVTKDSEEELGNYGLDLEYEFTFYSWRFIKGHTYKFVYKMYDEDNHALGNIESEEFVDAHGKEVLFNYSSVQNETNKYNIRMLNIDLIEDASTIKYFYTKDGVEQDDVETFEIEGLTGISRQYELEEGHVYVFTAKAYAAGSEEVLQTYGPVTIDLSN